jgi:hypothetical protein
MMSKTKLEHALNYSRGKNKFDNCPEQRTCNDFDAFEKAVISDLSPRKGLAFICAPLKSGLHYQDPKKNPGEATWRLKDYALPRQYLAFDFDGFSSPEIFPALLTYLNIFRGLGYTTASHTAEAPRARAILLSSRPVSREEGIAVCLSIQRHIANQLGDGAVIFDESVYRGEQPIYTPVTTSELFHFNGNAVQVDALLQPPQAPSGIVRGTGLLLAMGAGLGGYEIPDRVEEGGRNPAVLAHVGYLRGSGVSEDLIPGMALNFNSSHCSPPLNDDEVLSIASRYEEKEKATTSEVDLGTSKWPDPKKITTALSPVPVFDLDLLPDVFKPFVADASELMQAPPDLIAVPLMVAAAATLGNGWAIAPKAKDLSWKVPPVLWGAIVGRPGTKKSPCMDKALFPLLDIEMKLAKDHDIKLQKFRTDKLLYEAQLNNAKTQAKKTGTAPLLPPEPEEPQPERLIANDILYQKLGDILHWSPRGVAVVMDELVGLLETVEANGQEGARAFYLAAWNGNQQHRIDRIGRGSIVIDRLSICVLGGMQPGKLQKYVRQATQGGNSDDGLMQRFQLLVWPDVSSEWVNVDRYHDQQAINDVMAAFTRLRDLAPGDVNAKEDPFGGPAYLKFDADAQKMFNKAWARFEKLVRSEKISPTLEAHFSKYPRMIAALALVIHLVDGGVGPVSVIATRKAIGWAGYLTMHAKRAYGASDNAAAQSAKALAEKIETGSVKSGFTARSVQRNGWQNLSTKDGVAAALEWLIDNDWVVAEEISSKGRPTIVYIINPKSLGQQ